MDSSAAFSAKVERYGASKKRREERFQKLSHLDLTRKELQVRQKQELNAVTQVAKARGAARERRRQGGEVLIDIGDGQDPEVDDVPPESPVAAPVVAPEELTFDEGMESP